jgi:DNA-directed RNA polymerase subunit K/omega
MTSTISHDIETYQKIKDHDRSKYISLPVMTKYEFNALIGLRTMHLGRNATVFVEIEEDFKIEKNMDLRKIAIRELKEKRLPYMIVRSMPNGKKEYWPVSELNLITVDHMIA